MSKDIKLMEESIKHHYRMLEWAKKQNPFARALESTMSESLGETWYAEDCPLCREYGESTGCLDCPIAILGVRYDKARNNPGTVCSLTPWAGLARANTWRDWVEVEEVFIRFLERILAELKEDEARNKKSPDV